MLTAALKSYGRAIELEDTSVFSLVESGNIHLMLGSFNKGVEHFRRALEISPDSISALFGNASALLGMSKDCMRSGAFSWGASLLKEASHVIKSSTYSAGNKACLWKLYGDIQIEYSKCLPWDCESDDIVVDEKTFKTSVYSWRRSRLSSAVAAKICYQRALHLCPWQANAYTDIALSLDLLCSLEERKREEEIQWFLPEKLTIGSLLLEGANHDTWVLLGCLSNDNALKQHAFIRSLQLDVSLSVGWAHLGKLYRKAGEMKLARKAFDHARSIDPSLAIPWAGMAADANHNEFSANEAYESSLRAVQILPVSDFQVGLGALAKLSGHLLCPQVLGAVQQAVKHAPFLPESHNLNGLVCEARRDLHKAIVAYRQAKYALNINSTANDSELLDVSRNLARSLCLSGYTLDAAKECEELKKRGALDSRSLQVYAVALWQLGKNDMALVEAKRIASDVSNLDPSAAVAALRLICRLLYCIAGANYTVSTISRIPSVLLRDPKITFIRYAINALEPNSELQSRTDLIAMPHEEACKIHCVVALGKTLTVSQDYNLEFHTSVNYLKRVLHMHPDSSLIRNELCFHLLQSKDRFASHTATRCIVRPTGLPAYEGSKSAYEMIGCASVACYSNSSSDQRCSFTTCGEKNSSRSRISHLQKWLHKEPWNDKARYLLALVIMQKAREENFPKHLCAMLRRLIFSLLSREGYHIDNGFLKYHKFQLLLCASEICLQSQEHDECMSHAFQASKLETPGSTFFAHLQLCRAYAAIGDSKSLRNEYINCMKLGTDHEIGWISLAYLAYKFELQDNINSTDSEVPFLLKNNVFESNWLAILSSVLCQNFLWHKDLVHAENTLSSVLSADNIDRCLLLCHGAICLELARQQLGSEYLYRAVSSLSKVQRHIRLPFVSSLHAIAEGSLGFVQQWAKNLRAEWFSWPAATRPAEMYFQMHLLANKTSLGSNQHGYIEFTQSPDRWVLRAIHLNPSCLRYWATLEKLMSWHYTR